MESNVFFTMRKSCSYGSLTKDSTPLPTSLWENHDKMAILLIKSIENRLVKVIIMYAVVSR